MKSLFVILLSIVFFTACKKENINAANNVPTLMEISFDALEQQNVSHYKIEVSENGSSFQEMGMIFSDYLVETKYSIQIDVTKFTGHLYARVKSVDEDGKFSYSKILIVR